MKGKCTHIFQMVSLINFVYCLRKATRLVSIISRGQELAVKPDVVRSKALPARLEVEPMGTSITLRACMGPCSGLSGQEMWWVFLKYL